jgi:hypothetical protein
MDIYLCKICSHRVFNVKEVEGNSLKEAIAKTIKENSNNKTFRIHLTKNEQLGILSEEIKNEKHNL